MLYDMDPDITTSRRKFRRNIRTIIYLIKKENDPNNPINLHKYIIKEDLRLKFLDFQYRLKLSSVI